MGREGVGKGNGRCEENKTEHVRNSRQKRWVKVGLKEGK